SIWRPIGVQLAASASASEAANSAAYSMVCLRRMLMRDRFLDLGHFSGERAAQDLGAVFGHKNYIFDPNADVLFRDVNPWLDRDDHAGLEGSGRVKRVVYIETDMVTEAVREVLAERLAVPVLA